MTKTLEDNFTKLLQEVGLRNLDININMNLARQIYDGGFVNGLQMGQNVERQKNLEIIKKRNRYGGLSPRVYDKIKQKIEGER